MAFAAYVMYESRMTSEGTQSGKSRDGNTVPNPNR